MAKLQEFPQEKAVKALLVFDQFEGGGQKHIYYSHKSGFDPPIWPPINHLHISLPAQIVQIKWKNLSIAEGKSENPKILIPISNFLGTSFALFVGAE